MRMIGRAGKAARKAKEEKRRKKEWQKTEIDKGNERRKGEI
jgi:hypothetical protein